MSCCPALPSNAWHQASASSSIPFSWLTTLSMGAALTKADDGLQASRDADAEAAGEESEQHSSESDLTPSGRFQQQVALSVMGYPHFDLSLSHSQDTL